MDLRGWDYTGRNIGPEFHKQFRLMIYCLSMKDFVNNRKWNNELQTALAPRMGVGSPGAVRTVKKISQNFGLINEDAFSSHGDLAKDELLSERGKVVYNAAVLEYQVQNEDGLDNNIKIEVQKNIKILYEEAYCDALLNYYFINRDGTYFSPLRATLRTLQRHERLDKWEWYMFNTFVRHDDRKEEEEKLDYEIERYRKGDYSFTMENVVEKPKGHQYIPQYFEFAGLVHVVQRPQWYISNSSKHQDIKDIVLSTDYLEKVYSGGINNEL